MKDLVIDLSHWNDPVDFTEIRDSGIIGVIHKATEGSSYVDDTYSARKDLARSAGLLWGAYHFMRPGDQEAHARHFVDVVGEIDIYVADHEDDDVSIEDLKDWLAEVENLVGRTPVVYSGHVIKDQIGNGHDQELAKSSLWLAQYTSGTPSWPKSTWSKWWLWQYTDQGDNPGVAGNCDLNKYDGTEEELTEDWIGEEIIPPEQAEVTIKITTKGAVSVKVVQDES
jgi:lysozyme